MTFLKLYKKTHFEDKAFEFDQPLALTAIRNDSNSIKVGKDSWAVVYSGEDYMGDYLKLNPGESHHNLGIVARGEHGGDWKHQIRSFTLYGSKPAWWDSNEPPMVELPVQDDQAAFSISPGFKGFNATLNSPGEYPDLSKEKYENQRVRNLKNSIASLVTGNKVWMEVYADEDYNFSTLYIYPGSSFSDLNEIHRKGGGDWKNQIASLKMFDHFPKHWGIGMDVHAFKNQWPGQSEGVTDFGGAFHYVTQDAKYRQHWPRIRYREDYLEIKSKIDYEALTGTDDHITYSLTVGKDGSTRDFNYEWSGGKAYHISDTVKKVVEKGTKIAAALGALETAGVSEEAAESFVDGFDKAVKIFNFTSREVYHWAQNTDGRFYFAAVLPHAVIRLVNSIVVAAPVASTSVPPAMKFDKGRFEESMRTKFGLPPFFPDWLQWPDTKGELNTRQEFERGFFTYRTFHPEITLFKENAGMLLSCKIDFARETGDDHIILLMAFRAGTESAPVPLYAQVSVQFHGKEELDIVSTPVLEGDFGLQIHDQLKEKIKDYDFGKIDDTTAGRMFLPNVAMANIDSIISAVQYE